MPSNFCRGLRYDATEVQYNADKVQFKTTARGCLLELPLEDGEEVFGFGLQLKGFNHKGHKLTLRANSRSRCQYRRQPRASAFFCDESRLWNVF